VTDRVSAARLKLPVRATASNTRSWFSVIGADRSATWAYQVGEIY
jgi:hypothetical protein